MLTHAMLLSSCAQIVEYDLEALNIYAIYNHLYL